MLVAVVLVAVVLVAEVAVDSNLAVVLAVPVVLVVGQGPIGEVVCESEQQGEAMIVFSQQQVMK